MATTPKIYVGPLSNLPPAGSVGMNAGDVYFANDAVKIFVAVQIGQDAEGNAQISFVNATPIVGAQGEQGIQGEVGPVGPEGPAGE
jgi:hypothetical protein